MFPIPEAIALLKAAGKEPSVRSVAAVLRGVGLPTRWGQITQALKALRENPGMSGQHLGNTTGNERATLLSTAGNSTATPRADTRAPADPKGVVSHGATPQTPSPSSSSNSQVLPGLEGQNPPPRTRRSKTIPPAATWVVPLRDACLAIKTRELQTLTADERLTLGRYHAYKFGNCTKDELRNRRHGVDIAKGLLGMAQHREWGTLTVAAYANYGCKTLENRGGAPFFDPWLVISAVELRSAQA